MFIELHPQIAASNLDELRAHYKDYLRSKNLNDKPIQQFLYAFDIARQAENYEWICKKMLSIGVELI